jgi:protein ImuB
VLVVRCPAWLAAGQGDPASQVAVPDALAFEQAVSAVREFCPQVEVLRPGICAIGVRGPARFFGGEAELARKISEAVTRLGFDCRVGIADGLYAALLAAKMAPAGDGLGRDGPAEDAPAGSARPVVLVPPGASPAFLAPHPVAVLGQPELADLLSRLGIRTLGEFAALSVAEAETRFGAQGLLAHRLARGLDPRPLAARPPSADLSVQIEFDPPARQSEPVVFAAKSLASQMHSRLAAGGLACVRMRVQVICSDGQEISRLWRHDGLLSELAVAERVRWQLDGWRAGQHARDPGEGRSVVADGGTGGVEPDGYEPGGVEPDGFEPGGVEPDGFEPGGVEPDGYEPGGVEPGGITLLRLVPDQLVHDRGRQLGLWGDALVSDRVARAAVRVQAMLGHDAVRHPVPAGGRSPVEQALPVPFGDAQVPRLPADRPWPGRIPAPAPATVYSAPRPATVTDSSGELVTVTGRGQISASPAWLSVGDRAPLAVTAWTGPWPVSERWWDPAHACRKARFQLVTGDGNAWLAVVQDSRWLIEASYD